MEEGMRQGDKGKEEGENKGGQDQIEREREDKRKGGGGKGGRRK